MKHFKTQTDIRAIDEGQEHLIQPDWVLLSDEELHTLLNPPKTEEQLLAEAKAEALSYLASTDWYIMRFADSGVEVPQDVKYKRAEARLKI